MSVLSIKPHYLSYLVVSEGYKDELGDFHKGESTWVEDYIDCDAVPAGKEEVITYPDGTVGHYAYTLYTTTKCREFSRGDKISIRFFGSSERKEFEVKGYHRYQHQVKIWV